MMTPTDILRQEHALILRALDALEAATARLERGEGVLEDWWEQAIAWLRGFADRNHHAKEERALFPALVRSGVPAEAGGPIGVMLGEHEEGRALLRMMEAGDDPVRICAGRAYVDLLRAHIDKEDHVLFPLAEMVLDDATQRALAREFESLDNVSGLVADLDGAAVWLDGMAATFALAAATR
jgi:hemerythrin-like domain-containing protein